MNRNGLRICVIFLLSLLLGSIGLTANFNDNGNGTVTDYDTGLVWQQGESAMKDWETAYSYCDSLSLAGQSDWRLPNIEELKTIVDYHKYKPAIDTTYFPDFPDVNHSYYWSSTTHDNMKSYAGAVHFFSGGVAYGYMGGSHFVRCVRGRIMK